MQITPIAAREWARETGLQDFENQIANNHAEVLREPERNIQIGCWYLEKMRERYRDTPAPEVRALAAYNAGATRVTEWQKTDKEPLGEEEFVNRIDIPSTRSYVTSILRRYREIKEQ